MTEKEIALETIRALPDDSSRDEIAERIEFMAAVQKGLDQLDRGEGIPHNEIKRQLAHGLQTNLVPLHETAS
jgi:predicted transcriptional regulator